MPVLVACAAVCVGGYASDLFWCKFWMNEPFADAGAVFQGGFGT